MRDVGREGAGEHGAVPQVVSRSLAGQRAGSFTTPSQAARSAALRRQIQAALDDMAPLDHEVLALRHYERLSNAETAGVLGITEAAASNRYVRALRRLKKVLTSVPD